MPLSAAIIDLLRDEVGDQTDFVDNIVDEDPTSLGSLEAVYTDINRGNFSVLRTALIVWRKRLASHTDSSFDVTSEGQMLLRSQKTKELRRQTYKYERLVDDTLKGSNQPVQGLHYDEAQETAEF